MKKILKPFNYFFIGFSYLASKKIIVILIFLIFIILLSLLDKSYAYKVELDNITPGLYYVKTEKIDTADYTLIFDNFLISVPDLNEDGTWNYDVNVYPKAEEFIRHFEKITYTVLKQWIDDGISRPKSVDIEIYEDGKLIKKLSNIKV